MTTNPATRSFWVFAGSGLDVKRGYTNLNLYIKENIDENVFMFALFKCRKSDKGRN